MPKKTADQRRPHFGDRRIFPDFSRDRGHAAPAQKEFFFVYRMGVFPPTHHPLTSSACFGFPLLFPTVHAARLHAHQSHVCARKKANDSPAKKTNFIQPYLGFRSKRSTISFSVWATAASSSSFSSVSPARFVTAIFSPDASESRYEGHGNKANGTNVGSIQ